MTKKIFASIMTVSAVVLTLGMALILGVLYLHFNRQLFLELQKEAIYLSRGVSADGVDYLKGIEEKTDRITYIAGDGTVLFDNQADASAMENHREREEVKAALENGSGKAVRRSDTLAERTVYYAKKMNNGNVLRVSSTQYTLTDLIYQLMEPVTWILGGMILLSLFAASRLSRKIMEPVNQINLEAPEENMVYEELAPLLSKIRRQNRQIQNQLEAARRQQEEFSIITENMREGLLVIDRYTMILSGNSSAWKFFQSGPRRDQSVYSLNRSEPFRGVVEKALGGEHCTTVLQIGEQYIHVIANPVTRNGNVEGAVLLLVDRTESMEREELRREFSANVSHELMTPLTSISGYAEILKGGLVDEKDVQDFYGKIYDEAQRLIALVEDTIRLSQLDEGQVPYEKENVELYQLSREVCASLKEKADRNHVHFYIEGRRTVVKSVKPVLSEILYNLCDNAVKYNREEGSVTICLEQKGKLAHVTVEDTGMGIPETEQERIFERFYRVDKSHSSQIGGTGLGLSIVKHGVRFLGGTLELESREGEGTKITLILPC